MTTSSIYCEKKEEFIAILKFLRSIFEGKDPENIFRNQIPSNHHLQILIYYYCRNSLPPEFSAALQKTYYLFTIAEMRRKSTLDTVQKVLDPVGIRPYFLKGSLLAYHYYPDPVLRYSVDVDLLVAEQDSGKAFELLAQNGWTPAHEFHDLVGKHLPELRRKNLCTIEIHKHLFRGETGENKKLLDLLTQDPESPELLLTHLMYHAFYHHYWNNALKTVIDVGMIFRKRKIDHQKYRNFSKQFHTEGLLEVVLASFPECYPQSWRDQFPAENLSEEIKQAIRAFAFNSKNFFSGYAPKELSAIAKYSIESEKRFLWKKISSLSPAMLGATYRISKKKAYVLYLFLLFHYLITRGLRYLKMHRKNFGEKQTDLEKMYQIIGSLLDQK